MKIVFEEELKGPTGPIGKLGTLPHCPKCGAYHLMWDPETDISKCRCCGYENIEEARQNFEKQLKRGERSADEAKAYTIRKENAVPFTVDEPADDEWLKKHAEGMKKMLKSSVVMGRIYADIDEKAAVIRETVELKHVNRKRLKELIEADKDGRVVVLPCKVGDTLFRVFAGEIFEHRVGSMKYFAIQGRWDIETYPFCPYVESSIGKTIFLTREEAEKALEAMKDE